MHSDPLDMLSVSDLCVDLLLTGNVRPRFGQVEQLVGGYALALGGSANIFAAQVARLGGRMGLIGVAGDDPFGRFALDSLHRLNIDTGRFRRDSAVQTGLGVALCEPADRAILTVPGSLDAVTAADLETIDPACTAHFHIASFYLLSRLRTAWPAFVRRLRAAQVTVSLDTNFDPAERWDGLAELLPLVDVFLPNAAEARGISGESDLVRAGRRLAAQGPLVVIKDGANGAFAFPAGGRTATLHRPAVEVNPARLVDTVGAGDCFDAGFLRAWQLEFDLSAALNLGLQCAAASLTAAGGIAGQLQVDLSSPALAAPVH